MCVQLDVVFCSLNVLLSFKGPWRCCPADKQVSPWYTHQWNCNSNALQTQSSQCSAQVHRPAKPQIWRIAFKSQHHLARGSQRQIKCVCVQESCWISGNRAAGNTRCCNHDDSESSRLHYLDLNEQGCVGWCWPEGPLCTALCGTAGGCYSNRSLSFSEISNKKMVLKWSNFDWSQCYMWPQKTRKQSI